MTATYLETLATDRDLIRFALGGSVSLVVVSDELIAGVLTVVAAATSPINAATVKIAASLASSYIGKPGSFKDGDTTISWNDRAKAWRQLAIDITNGTFSADPAVIIETGGATWQEVSTINFDFLEPDLSEV